MEGLLPALLQVVTKKYKMVRFLLPPPEWPTRATILPGGSFRVKSLSTSKPGRQG